MQWSVARFRNPAITFVRVVTGIIFSMHGLMIFHLIPSPVMAAAARGVGHAPSGVDLHVLAGILEIAGGWLVVLGLFTAPTSFLLSGEMAVAYFKVHFANSFWPLYNQGDSAVLYCFIFLMFVFIDPGPFSADAVIRRYRGRHADANLPANKPVNRVLD